MKQVEYEIPIFTDNDKADLNLYSSKMAEALKKQLDKFGNPLIFKGIVDNIDELENIKSSLAGEIYCVKNVNKNYIFNGEGWQIYSDNFNIENIFSEISNNYISDEYSASSTYALDDYCIYNNKLYKCIVAIKTAEEFNNDHWKETTISAELKNKLDFEVVEEF